MIKIGYHGTNGKIDVFDLDHLGKSQGQSLFPGIYFADNYNDALTYAKLAVEKFGGEPIVYIAECELESPLDIRKGGKLFNTIPDFLRFAKEYFPNWFDLWGNLPSYRFDYVNEKFSTYTGQYNFIRYAAEENKLPLYEVCTKLGFDSSIDHGQFSVLSPQQILSYQEVDHQLTDEEINQSRIPAEEDFEEVMINGIDLSGEHGFVGTQLSSTESLAAFETKSNDYIRAARKGKPYKTMPGNRFLRRLKIRMNGGNHIWFDIDMNRLFKKGSFAVKVPVIGETSEYACVISFDDWLPKLKDDIAKIGFTQLTVKRSLMEMLRFHDLKVRCSCPDFKYRHAYWLTVHNEIEDDPELRPSDKTNPKDDLGKICKHLNFCLNNKIYGDKESRIIYNYLINLKRTRRTMFDKIVAPKLGLDQLDESMGGTKKPEPVLEEPVKVEEPQQDIQQDNQQVGKTQETEQSTNPEGETK